MRIFKIDTLDGHPVIEVAVSDYLEELRLIKFIRDNSVAVEEAYDEGFADGSANESRVVCCDKFGVAA